jgi:hypothetical protein
MPRKAITALILGVSLMVCVAAVLLAIEQNGRAGDGLPDPAEPMAGSVAGPSTFDATLPLEERIQALEQAVSDERYARQLLQDELFVLTSEIEALTAPRAADAGEGRSGTFERIEAEPEEPQRGRGAGDRVTRLVDAGFAPGQAEWIVQRESQLQMESLQARYEAERSGDAMNFFQSRNSAGEALRNELGDAEYERYLGASGRPTSISVSTVLDSSPAERAGLLPGDEIVSYDGKRIFSMSDLTRQTLEGEPGEQVIVDIQRDGVSMQVVMPRGPIGISGGRRFSR